MGNKDQPKSTQFDMKDLPTRKCVEELVSENQIRMKQVTFFIESRALHGVFNMCDSEPVVAFVARSTSDEWDKILLHDHNSEG